MNRLLDRAVLVLAVVTAIADLVSRVVDDGTVPAQVATVLVGLLVVVALVATLLPGAADGAAIRAVTVLLVAASLVLRVAFWETGLGSPLRAVVPSALAVLSAAWVVGRTR